MSEFGKKIYNAKKKRNWEKELICYSNKCGNIDVQFYNPKKFF